MPQLDPFIFFDEAFTAAVFFLLFYRYAAGCFVPLVLRTRVVLRLLNLRAAVCFLGMVGRTAPLADSRAVRPRAANAGSVGWLQ